MNIISHFYKLLENSFNSFLKNHFLESNFWFKSSDFNNYISFMNDIDSFNYSFITNAIGTAATNNTNNSQPILLILCIPFSCILDITYAVNNITNTFENSAGWNVNEPKLNHLLAPSTGTVNNTPTSKIQKNTYHIGETFAITS